jgi:putative cell wall-binding protein
MTEQLNQRLDEMTAVQRKLDRHTVKVRKLLDVEINTIQNEEQQLVLDKEFMKNQKEHRKWHREEVINDEKRLGSTRYWVRQDEADIDYLQKIKHMDQEQECVIC